MMQTNCHPDTDDGPHSRASDRTPLAAASDLAKRAKPIPLARFLLHTDHRRRSHRRPQFPLPEPCFTRRRRGRLTGFQFTQALQVRIHLTDFRCGVVVMLFLLHIQRAPFLSALVMTSSREAASAARLFSKLLICSPIFIMVFSL